MTIAWRRLGARDPVSLTSERLQLHYGAWILGSVADSVLPGRNDDSHTNLGFDLEPARLSTPSLADDREIRIALQFADLALTLRIGDSVLAGFELTGNSFCAALEWAGAVIGDHIAGAGQVRRREYPDFPASGLADGEPFASGDREARLELGRYYRNALVVIDQLATHEPSMSEVRIWPHHFDLGATLSLGEEKLVGLGLSPGDGAYDEPYFYAYPYPLPDELPQLAGAGHWHTEGFTAAVLTGSRLLAEPDQEEVVTTFLTDALEVCRKLLQK